MTSLVSAPKQRSINRDAIAGVSVIRTGVTVSALKERSIDRDPRSSP